MDVDRLIEHSTKTLPIVQAKTLKELRRAVLGSLWRTTSSVEGFPCLPLQTSVVACGTAHQLISNVPIAQTRTLLRVHIAISRIDCTSSLPSLWDHKDNTDCTDLVGSTAHVVFHPCRLSIPLVELVTPPITELQARVSSIAQILGQVEEGIDASPLLATQFQDLVGLLCERLQHANHSLHSDSAIDSVVHPIDDDLIEV